MLGKLIAFPLARRAGVYRRLWAERLDRLHDYVNTIRTGEDPMSDLSFDYPKDQPLIVMTRTFEAPRALVWKCFSEREHLARWWGPRSIAGVIRIEAFDFRAGGRWRFVCQRPDGSETIVFYGSFLEVVAPERFVSTFAWEQDAPADDALTETHTFEERGETTFYRAVSSLASIEARDAMVATGMEKGARESMAQLDELLAALAAPAR
jgi:uncharacterized protein YndB with AHSA1/START domain